MVVAEIDGVVNAKTPVPPESGAPPVGLAYQSTVSPNPTVADRFTVPVLQTDPPVPTGATGGVVTTTGPAVV
jgi:hypothetical protein